MWTLDDFFDGRIRVVFSTNDGKPFIEACIANGYSIVTVNGLPPFLDLAFGPDVNTEYVLVNGKEIRFSRVQLFLAHCRPDDNKRVYLRYGAPGLRRPTDVHVSKICIDDAPEVDISTEDLRKILGDVNA